MIRQIADRICIMYAGLIVETGPSAEIFSNPQHPYTRALLSALPDIEQSEGRLVPIEGTPPAATAFPQGCRYAPRCLRASDVCRQAAPALLAAEDAQGVKVACHHTGDVT